MIGIDSKSIRELLEEFSKISVELTRYEPLSVDWHAAMWAYKDLSDAIIARAESKGDGGLLSLPRSTFDRESRRKVHLSSEAEDSLRAESRVLYDLVLEEKIASGDKRLPWIRFQDEMEELANKYGPSTGALQSRIHKYFQKEK